MQDINQQITNTYTQNIAYLQEQHKEVFEKISALDNAVTNGHYKEKYELVYENDGFDVFEAATGNYLYNKNIAEHTQLSLKSVNKNLDNNLFECFSRQHFTQEQLQEFKKLAPLETHLQYVAPLIDYIQNNTNNQEIPSFQKYIFFGTGLGVHIEAIANKIKANYYFIVEDDLELFRLSLMCTNYANLAKDATLFFSVFDTKEEFEQKSETFLEQDFYMNHYIKYFHLLSHSEEKYNTFYLTITNQPHIRFLFHHLLSSQLTPLNYFDGSYPILQKTLNFTDKTFENKPSLLVASGPSLQKNILWLQKKQDSFTIVSVSSALHLLEEYGIVPDIMIHTDPFIASTRSFEKLNSLTFLDNTLLFFNASTHPDVIEKVKGKNLFFFESDTNYQKSALKISGGCVGSSSLLLLILLNMKNLYLLGLDLAIDSQTGSDHISSHQSAKKLNTKEDAFESTMSYKENVFYIEGNKQAKILTTPHFYGSVQIINRYFPQIKRNEQQIFNLSDGAKFSVATPQQPQEIQESAYAKIDHTSLKELILSHTKQGLSLADLDGLEHKCNHAIEIKNKLNKLSLKNFTEPKKYMQALINILHNQQDLTDYDLPKVLETFSRYTLEYGYFFLLEKHTKEEKEELQKLLKEPLFELIDLYITTLQTTLKDYNARYTTTSN
jgi:hypothetical protein